MVELTNKRLNEILKKINRDPQTRQQYYSRLNSILQFLSNNTGLKNVGIREGGSQAKQTDTRKSDIDIIFSTSPDQDQQVIRRQVLEKAKKAFGKIAVVKLGTKAIHVDFISPKCNFDLVYKTQKKFQEEKKKINIINKLRPIQKRAVKLAKYALDKSKIKNIKGYEVELACINVNSTTLPECVIKIITYFKGRIEKNGLSVDKVLQRLT